MGLFSLTDKERAIRDNKEITNRYVEIISSTKSEELEYEIAKRIEKGRIIKNIEYSSEPSMYSALILYDTWAEKAKADKERGIGLGR